MTDNAVMSVPTPSRVTMISMHTSPLEVPGVSDAGGLNVYVYELARRLGARGMQVDIVTRRSDPDSPDSTQIDDNVCVMRLAAGPPAPVAKEDLPGLAPEFTDRISQRVPRPDLVHSHYWLSGLAGLEIAASWDAPLVHTMHTMARVKNDFPAGAGHRPEPGARDTGESRIVAGAQALTANTADERSELIGHYGARDDRIFVVPPGVDLTGFHPCDRPASRAAHDLDQDAKIILFVGRLQPLKAPDVMIDAVAELARRRPEWRDRLRLIIVGSLSGPHRDWAATLPELIAQHDMTEQIQLRPHSPREELFRWYCAADVVAVPSYNESFGLVALEAQACGRPVIATDVGGLRHAVLDGETGTLVEGHDPIRWANACEQILDDPELRAEYGRRAGIHAAGFSWDNTAAATLDCYASVLRHSLQG